ncbi:MAG: TolC family protein [Bacteroidota bacterium]
MSRLFVIVLLPGLLVWHGHTAYGQAEANPDSALQATLRSLPGTSLSLRQAVDLALENATSVRRAEAGHRAADAAVRREEGAFDPRLFFNLNYADQKVPTASFFAGAPVLSTQQTATQSGLSMNLPIGTQLQLSLNTVRLGTNSSFAFLNPEYDAFGSLTVRQPLLGGFAASARKQLSQAEKQSEGGKDRYDQQILTVTSEVERMYWDLYAAERDYVVQILTRDRAAAFLKETQLRAKAGLVGPDQVANARTFLAEQALQLLDREEALDLLSDQIASLIGTRPGGGTDRYITTDEPTSSPGVGSVDSLVAQAVRGNLDLHAAHTDVEAAAVLSEAARWEALPSVDLVGSLGGTGLGGNAQGVIFGTDTLRIATAPGFGDALKQVYRRLYPNWSIGVEVSIPLGFRSGLGEKDRLEEEVISAQQTYLEKRRMLEEQVRSTCRELENGRSRLDAAREGVEAAHEQVRIGIIEFRNGRSTAFELVRLGEDLAVAERRYSQALVRTAKAAATLKQLTSGAYRGTSNQ